LTGFELFSIAGIADGLAPGELLAVTAKQDGGKVINFQVKCRLDSLIEIEYYRHGGILQFVLRDFLSKA